jgi:GDP-4-dehydro-6-deoxy-D-mannose reductase
LDTLVIGAGGFVGSYLLRQLLAEGKLPGATKLPHEKIKVDGVDVFDLDLGSQNAVRSLLAQHRPPQIYHLAAQSSVALSWKEPEQTIDVNIKGTLHLLEAVRSIP